MHVCHHIGDISFYILINIKDYSWGCDDNDDYNLKTRSTSISFQIPIISSSSFLDAHQFITGCWKLIHGS